RVSAHAAAGVRAGPRTVPATRRGRRGGDRPGGASDRPGQRHVVGGVLRLALLRDHDRTLLDRHGPRRGRDADALLAVAPVQALDELVLDPVLVAELADAQDDREAD